MDMIWGYSHFGTFNTHPVEWWFKHTDRGMKVGWILLVRVFRGAHPFETSLKFVSSYFGRIFLSQMLDEIHTNPKKVRVAFRPQDHESHLTLEVWTRQYMLGTYHRLGNLIESPISTRFNHSFAFEVPCSTQTELWKITILRGWLDCCP